MKSVESAWLEAHEGRWGAQGVKMIAERGVSPHAWDVPGNRAEIQRLAKARYAALCALSERLASR
jgi:hypothetical protein